MALSSNARVTVFEGTLLRELRAFVASVSFLTRLPVGSLVALDGSDVARSSVWFPLVGAGIGAAVGGVATLLAHAFPPVLAAVMAVLVGVLLTGALHVDALADTFDALGARSRERALEVMRDSTVGAYGVVAIVADLLMRVAVIDVLVVQHRALVYGALAGAISRLSPVVLSAILPYARADTGLGLAFTRASRLRAVWAAVLASGLALGLAGERGALALIVILALTAGAGLFFRRWLGGVTGDTLGAAAEVGEVFVLLFGVALVAHS
jgi:adenosylcobinamide-GDP ribazoletransferase